MLFEKRKYSALSALLVYVCLCWCVRVCMCLCVRDTLKNSFPVLLVLILSLMYISSSINLFEGITNGTERYKDKSNERSSKWH